MQSFFLSFFLSSMKCYVAKPAKVNVRKTCRLHRQKQKFNFFSNWKIANSSATNICFLFLFFNRINQIFLTMPISSSRVTLPGIPGIRRRTFTPTTTTTSSIPTTDRSRSILSSQIPEKKKELPRKWSRTMIIWYRPEKVELVTRFFVQDL